MAPVRLTRFQFDQVLEQLRLDCGEEFKEPEARKTATLPGSLVDAEFLTLCSVPDWERDRTNPIVVDKWAEKIATGLLAILQRWWTDDDDPQPLDIFEFMLMAGGNKLLTLKAKELAKDFAETGCLSFKLRDLVKTILLPVISVLDDYGSPVTLLRHASTSDAEAEEYKKKEEEEEAPPPSYEQLFGTTGGGEETKKAEEEEEEEEEELKKKKKKKKKNKNNQKERLRMKTQLEEEEEKKENQAPPPKKRGVEKEGWNGPCGLQ